MSLQGHREAANDVDSQPRYNKLPPELWNIIIDLACLGPPSSPSSSGSFFSRDVPTMLSLNLVCLEMHDYVQPKIYQKIAITRPSALYALHQVLQAHPERAKLVESIHIGPQEILPPEWWPLSVLNAGRRLPSLGHAWLDRGIPRTLRRLLSTSLDQDSLPFGCESRQAWSLDRTESSCREMAVYKALKTAQHSLGIELVNARGPHVERVLEVQAVLDLYLTHIKSIEKQRPELILMARPGAQVPLHAKINDFYPPLALTDLPASISASNTTLPHAPRAVGPDFGPFQPPQAYDNAFALPYHEVLCHLARRGTLTDRFDHPLLLSRSGFDIQLLAPKVIRRHRNQPAHFCPSGYGYQLHHPAWYLEDVLEASPWPQLTILQGIANAVTTSPEEKALLTRVIHTSTLASILRLARGVLAATTSVRTVSLTGFLQHAVGSTTQELPALRRLSLGRPPTCWKANLALQGLDQVGELRICGTALEWWHVDSLTSSMQRLRLLMWSMWERHPSSGSFSVAQVVQGLMKGHFPPPTSGAPSLSSSSSQVAPAERSDNEDSHGVLRDEVRPERGMENALPLLRARLHPTDVQTVLATAPDQGTRSAWLEGRPTSTDCRRLLLEQCAPADNDSIPRPSLNSKSRALGGMYEEGRRWVRGE